MTDHDDAELTDDAAPAEDDEPLLDHLRGTGVGVEDPNVVGEPTPLVDEHVAEDEPPQV